MHTILVPPLLCSARVYGPLLDAVWQHGSVGIADTRRDVSIADIAARLLRDAPARFALVGTSMGGHVALEVVRQAPSRVSALALVSTSARADTPAQRDTRRQQSQLVEDGHFDDMVDATFPYVVAPHNAGNTAFAAEWRAMASAVGPDTFLRQQKAIMGRTDSRELLSSITCPAIVVHGAADQLIPVDIAREISDGVPNGDLVVLDQAGHFVFHEQPEQSVGAVVDLLTSIE
nr:alpha/beta hydrolase [Rhodococcus sp. (in: high G+C Gram-positive bacteria)]